MMKHIKKKTVEYIKFNPEVIEKKFDGLMIDIPDGKMPKLNYKDVKDKQAFLLLEGGEMLRTFFYNDNGNTCTIPIANPVLIYFHSSQINLRHIYAAKKNLLNLFTENKKVDEGSLQLFYDFFGLTSSFVVLLMTALEAFVNQNIQADYKYEKREANKFTKTYDNSQIQRWIPLDEKIKEILNKTTGKNFSKQFANRQIHITNLKDLRDDIVHTKKGADYENYTNLFKKTLGFKFNESIEAVRDFINYYESNLIEPCPCGSEF